MGLPWSLWERNWLYTRAHKGKRSRRKEALAALLVAGNLLSGVLVTDIMDGGLVLLQNAVRLDHPDRIRRVLTQPAR